jgi:hypothetical protein
LTDSCFLCFVFLLLLQITKANGTVLPDITVPGFGENSMVRRPINIGEVKQLRVQFSGSGTITYIKYRTCPTAGGTTFPAPPGATCLAEYYQNECTTNTHCTSKYTGTGITCNSGAGNVCFKSGSPRGCQETAPFTT